MNIETFRDDFTGMEMHSTVLSSGMKAYFFPTLPIAQIAMYNLLQDLEALIQDSGQKTEI